MEKTIITNAVFAIVKAGLRIIAKRTDNKVDDKVIDFVEAVYKK